MQQSSDRDYLAALVSAVAQSQQLSAPVAIDKPSDASFGDFSSNLAMLTFKQVADRFQQPRAWAEELSQLIMSADREGERRLADVSVAGPGFINFTLQQASLWANLQPLLSQAPQFTNLGQGRSAIVEYSSPNIAKPFTIGHLRSTIIGQAVANLLEASGYRVFRDNHLGDWGTQFGKQIVAIKKWGDEAKIEQAAEPVKELVELYVKFHQEAEVQPALEDEARAWFLKLEQGDQEARRLWQKCIDWSFREFAAIYERLGVHFTENEGRGFGESYFEDKMTAVITELKDSGLAKTGEEGALLIFYPADEFSPLMVLKKDGSTLYATRDLATDKWRREQARYQNPDGRPPLVINEVGGEQAYYFQQLYRAEELLGWYQPGERVHVKHGLYRFKEGKMSTRKGNVIWLQEVLDKALEKASVINADPKVATTVSMAALKWNDLKRKSELNINFDWDEMLQLQGNSGPYLLYSYVRTQSVLSKQTASAAVLAASLNQQAPLSTEEKAVLALLPDFTKTVAKAASSYAPNLLCTYLYELAQAFNTFYNKQQILNADANLRPNRLALTAATGTILRQGLTLLGIETVESM